LTNSIIGLFLGYYFGSCGKISQPELIADKVKKRVVQDATKEAEAKLNLQL
jgi:hypothetical protein